MKKSRIAKLALMGASITALAATLTTSTYAWYVSNKTATVAASTGSTSSAGSDGSISLSTTGQYGTFMKSIALTSFNTAELAPVYTADGKTFNKLGTTAGATPVSSTYRSGITYYTTSACTTKADVSEMTSSSSVTSLFTKQAAAASATIAKTGYSPNDAGDVFCYSFFILADGTYDGTDSVTVTPTINIKNTTATTAYKSQINYSTLDVAGVGTGGSFYENALNALAFSGFATQTTTQYNKTNYNAASNVQTALNGKVADPLGLELLSTSTATNIVCSTDNALPEGAKTATTYAQEYYEEITGTELTVAQKTSATPSSIGNITIKVGAPVLLEFYLWLDGADQVCFNACEQQSFSVDFSFAVVGE